ncbi:MAG: hypothetical protein ACKVHL_08150 [Rhodospirillales bacterium]|jgi:hypothetical protein
MAEKNVTDPSQLQESWALLDQAVNRLEAAQTVFAKKEGLSKASASINANDQKQLQDENRALQDVNSAVSKRLDSVIDRLKSVLEV